MQKLAIITTHPIQYNAPLFKLLTQHKKIAVKVFYTWGQDVLGKKYDPGFGKVIQWDIPLLEGYDYTFVENIAKQPDSSHFTGIDNPGLIAEIKNYGATALLLFGWNFKSHLQCLRYFHKKIPLLFRGDSTLLNEQAGIKRIVRSIFLKWVYAHVDYALYVGSHNRNYFKRHGLKNHQLILAAHAIDNEKFGIPEDEYSEKANKWKQELGVLDNQLTVLYAGKLESVKNLFFILELADRLKDQPVIFILVGNGPLEGKLKEQAKYNKNIIFIDFQNQSRMPVVYRLGDIFILTSKSESWGLGVNEAMASGCAIAVSEKVGCAPDLVREDENGFVFALNDAENCADYFASLSVDKAKLLKMKQASVELIQNFNFLKIAESIENILIGKSN